MHSVRYWHHEQCMPGCGWWRLLAMPSTAVSSRAVTLRLRWASAAGDGTRMINAFHARSETSSAFRGLYCNRWLWGAVAMSIALQVAAVHLPALNVAFSTEPLSLLQWLQSVAFASCVIRYGEIRKLILRNHHRSRAGASR